MCSVRGMVDGSARPGAHIALATLPNLRDLGGWATAEGGRVRTGVLYRSTALDKVEGEDADVLAGLGLRVVYDLRTEGERSAEPDRVPADVDYVVADVLEGIPGSPATALFELLSDPAAAHERFGDGKGVTLFEGGYRVFVSLPSALAAYSRLFTGLAHDPTRPVLFHCTTGKDRTGWASAALLMLLGVPDELVLRDYLLTNEQLRPALQPLFDRFEGLGGDPELFEPMLGVREEYLRAALDEMRGRFGTIEGYFDNGLGLDAGAQDVLREAFTER